MARREVRAISVSCDVCGGYVIADAAGVARPIGWDGARYVVDLCETHDDALQGVLAQLKVFVDAGHRVAVNGRGVGRALRSVSVAPAARPGKSTRRQDVGEVRAWALAQNYQVGDRGRIPGWIFMAYDKFTAETQMTAPAAATVVTSASKQSAGAQRNRPAAKRAGGRRQETIAEPAQTPGSKNPPRPA
jgi:hypothetical protein